MLACSSLDTELHSHLSGYWQYPWSRSRAHWWPRSRLTSQQQSLAFLRRLKGCRSALQPLEMSAKGLCLPRQEKLTAVDVLAVPVLASQASSFVTQSVQFSRRELWFMLEVAEIAVLAVTTEVPVPRISCCDVSTSSSCVRTSDCTSSCPLSSCVLRAKQPQRDPWVEGAHQVSARLCCNKHISSWCSS